MVISITSDINFPLSPTYLFLTKAVCCEEIKSGRTYFDFSNRTFDIIFESTFNKEISLQSFISIFLFFYFFFFQLT